MLHELQTVLDSKLLELHLQKMKCKHGKYWHTFQTENAPKLLLSMKGYFKKYFQIFL